MICKSLPFTGYIDPVLLSNQSSAVHVQSSGLNELLQGKQDKVTTIAEIKCMPDLSRNWPCHDGVVTCVT
jgi:hypothetical protein